MRRLAALSIRIFTLRASYEGIDSLTGHNESL